MIGGAFVGGLALGLLLGVVVGPLVRLWISWREWSEASREARLTEDVLEAMERRPWRSTR
ncbi:MAG TPA: hypothetical protein VGB51_07300 [Actinomycetota bacterium]